MSDAPLAASVGPSDMLSLLQGNAILLATVGQIIAVPLAQYTSLSAAVVALTQRVAAVEGRPDPCVALTGSLPVATIAAGTMDMAVPVAGLLRTDTVSVEIEGDLPAGLDLRAMHPDRTRDGVLLVQAAASLTVALATVIPIRVTALR